jgi:hypothetical protein
LICVGEDRPGVRQLHIILDAESRMDAARQLLS